jgi:TRAP-type uncharacterized transport system substrate-binding protein
MRTPFMIRMACIAAIICLHGAGTSKAVFAQSPAVRDAAAAPPASPTAIAEGEAESVERVNKWTVGVVGGMIEGSPIRFASDIQVALDDGDNLRILPIISRGVRQNVIDLLYLKGVDVAVLYTDALDAFRKEGKIKNIDKRVNYISHLFLSGVHLIARPEIKTLKDLEGKKVGFQGKGTGVSVTSGIVYERAGVNVEPVYITNNQAIEKMKTGEIAALIYLVSKAHPSITSIDPKLGFHLVPIPYDKFMDYYVPMTFENSDYPNLVQPDEKVESIAVPAVLAVYNWPKNSDRYRKVERFIQYYFDRFDKFKSPPFQKEWKEINLSATVPGWTRYWLADQLLQQMDRSRQTAASAADAPALASQEKAPLSAGQNDPAARQMVNDFLEWKRKQKR